MVTASLHLIEFDKEENAEYITEALSNRVLLDMCRGRSAYTAMRPSCPTRGMIELEIGTCPGAWYMIKVNNENKGWVRLTPVDRWEASLGIVIADPACRDIGLGYNVCSAILQKAFPIFHRVSWYTWDYNEPSIMLAKKLGFHLVETYPHYGIITATMIQEHRILERLYCGLKFMKGRLDDFRATRTAITEEE